MGVEGARAIGTISGRIKMSEGTIGPITLAIRVPSARIVALTGGEPLSLPLIEMPPAAVNSAKA